MPGQVSDTNSESGSMAAGPLPGDDGDARTPPPRPPDKRGSTDGGRRPSEHEKELRLVREVLRGSPEAVQQFATYLARVPGIVAVHRSCTRVAVLEQDVPDLIQDCLSVIWRKLPGFEGRASLSTWIFRVCSLELCNGFRRIARRRWSNSGSARRWAASRPPRREDRDITYRDVVATMAALRRSPP